MFAIIDVETTGTVYKYGKITEIAIYVHDGQRITNSLVSLINPEIDIPIYITRLTGISNKMVVNAPRFFEIAKNVVELTTGRIFVAHNVNFDYQFIREEFRQLGYEFQRKKLCTVQLSKKFFPGRTSYSLGKLCADLGIEIEGRHRAAGDALATVRLFEKLLARNLETGKIPGLGKTPDLF